MNERDQENLQDQILQLLDGDLDRVAASRLDEELRESGEARKIYVQLSALHSALGELEESRSSIGQLPVIPIERLLARQRRQSILNALLAAAAILIVCSVVLWSKMVPPATAVASFRLSPDSAYSLSHAEGKETAKGPVLSRGSRLQLTRGVMEASFESGVRCVFKAPCDLTVLADDRISVADGVAWFHVPSSSVGFTVELPNLTVIDLGTEFGISAPAKESHEVHVMDGRVKVVTRNASSQPIELRAGEARKAGPAGALVEIPVQTEKFMDALPPRPSRLIINGDLNTTVNQYNDVSGDTAYSLNPRTLEVLANDIETDIQVNEWLWSGLTRGFQYRHSSEEAGGNGAFISREIRYANVPFRPRAVAQFSRDLKATKGTRTLRIDVMLDDNSVRGELTLLVELYAWNRGQVGPNLSMGGPHPNEPTYHVTTLNDAITVLSTQVSANTIADNSWESVNLGELDLSDGYDFYAWRIGVLSATVDDRFAFDNVRIAY